LKKEDFLDILRDYLRKDFSEDEVVDIVRDYEEYFIDGLIEGKSEIEIIQSLGSPKEIASELIMQTNIKNKSKVMGKVENFFIEVNGKFKYSLNKLKINLNNKNHAKSRKKISILQVILTICLIPFVLSIALATFSAGIFLICSVVLGIISIPFSISLSNIMPELKMVIIFLFMAFIGLEILIWQLFIKVLKLEKKIIKKYCTWLKTNQLYINASRKKEEFEKNKKLDDECAIDRYDGGDLDE
jgi:uncharacterized membrane protein